MGERHALPQQPPWRRPEVQIFDEVPEALALVLWQGLRHVRAWYQAPASRPAELFHPHPRLAAESRLRDARAAAPELRAALDGLLAITRSPLTAADRDVAAARAEIARWAEQNGHAQTAILFAEAAAVLAGGDPAFANHAGRLTRNAGEFARADLWFQRAIGLARSADASVEYTRAQLGYGSLWHTLGDVERARKHDNRGSVAAMRQGLEWLAAEAQHDIFALLAEFHLFDQAEVHARRALTWYPKRHERLPLLAADVAYVFICRGQFVPASALLKDVLRVVRIPSQRALIAASYVAAEAGCGRDRTLPQARRRIMKALADRPDMLAAAQMHLANAARLACMWQLAQADAVSVVTFAKLHQNRSLERIANDVLQRIARRVRADGEPGPTSLELIEVLRSRMAGWAPSHVGQSRSRIRREWVA